MKDTTLTWDELGSLLKSISPTYKVWYYTKYPNIKLIAINLNIPGHWLVLRSLKETEVKERLVRFRMNCEYDFTTNSSFSDWLNEITNHLIKSADWEFKIGT